MITYYFDLLDINFWVFLAFAGAVTTVLVLGIAFHEFCHALTASALGDQTAARLGRLTLNPLAHLDPLGSFLLVFVGFGWGKPTPVNPYNLRNGPKTGMAVVAAAGPASNIFVASLMALPIRMGITPWHDPFTLPNTAGWGPSDYWGLFFTAGVQINCLLAVFNLIPLAPLDGFKVAIGLLPNDLALPLMRLERYGIVILMGIFFLGPLVFGINVFGSIIHPIEQALAEALTGTST